jgi:hypothetical protein
MVEKNIDLKILGVRFQRRLFSPSNSIFSDLTNPNKILNTPQSYLQNLTLIIPWGIINTWKKYTFLFIKMMLLSFHIMMLPPHF